MQNQTPLIIDRTSIRKFPFLECKICSRKFVGSGNDKSTVRKQAAKHILKKHPGDCTKCFHCGFLTVTRKEMRNHCASSHFKKDRQYQSTRYCYFSTKHRFRLYYRKKTIHPSKIQDLEDRIDFIAIRDYKRSLKNKQPCVKPTYCWYASNYHSDEEPELPHQYPVRVKCFCGSEISKTSYYTLHQRTKKHKAKVKEILDDLKPKSKRLKAIQSDCSDSLAMRDALCVE